MSKQRRAFGVIRQSRTNDGSLSAADQLRRIEDACEREGMTLVQTTEELDVSGRTPLAKRKGLTQGIEAVEAGRADVIVVAYFDRLVRSLKVQAEALERVEAAGGKVLALDVGNVATGTAAEWLSSTFLGMVAEYHARATGERVWSSIVQAVADGRPPYRCVLPGLRKTATGHVEPDPETRDLIVQAYRMRAASPPASLHSIGAYLRENGIDVSHSTVQKILRSRTYLGELRFGDLVNENAWPAIVPADLYERVQSARAPRGRVGKSDLLLARQGIVHCATCNSRMTAGHVTGSKGQRVPVYRCQTPAHSCSRSAVMTARLVDEVVLAKAEEWLAEVHGHAALHVQVDAARARAEAAQDALTRAVSAFDGLGDESSVREKLQALKASRDAAVSEYEDLRDTVAPLETFSAEDLRGSDVVKQRRAIRVAIERVVVRPGRLSPDERLTVTPRGSEAVL